jgi:hypothetical protein
MKAIRILLHSAILAIVVSVVVFSQIDASSLFGGTAGRAEQERILAATLQIRVYPCIGHYYEQGLGTLVAYAGEKLILTHNHWGILDSFCKAQLRDVQDEILMDIPRQKFLALIQYQDAGSLLLRTPAGLNLPAVELDGQAAPGENETVLIVHQNPRDANRVDVMASHVQALNLQGAIPSFTIIALDGERIIKGDSGGGVWYSGKLVGNLWAYYKDQPAAQGDAPEAQVSIVARLPLDGFQARPVMSQSAAKAESPTLHNNVASEDIETLP